MRACDPFVVFGLDPFVVLGLDPSIHVRAILKPWPTSSTFWQAGGTAPCYIGVTNDVIRRVYEHKEGLVEGFTKRHGVKTLVYVESHDGAEEAIQREKNLKHWVRDWKIALIERENPHWEDLYEGLCR